ncbi:hypothetical protein J5N97_027783 [Dioscorea zingiberensis]|uniref:RING-type E3 ubiquitin transferase n=1 Tax=Dioscorea zingiberensis TaxID=325984 RepID=A0A9D5BXH9_9LILI|nr:hypothetical protein J5N97_027783 [Dioscorea zingiberensis]
MASTADETPTNTIGAFRRLLLLKKYSDAPKPPDRNPLIGSKKKGFAAAAFRGFGCASAAASQVHAPAAASAAAAVRSSADWQGGGRRARKRRAKQKKRKERRANGSGSGSGAASAGDVWCAPGIAFGADARPVDCVVAHHPIMGRGRVDSERVHRERAYNARRGVDQDHISSFMDSSLGLDEPLFGSDLLPPGHLRRFRGYRRSPGGLEEIMMFQTRLLLGRIDSFDQYRDLRLDVDNMTYEELLELGEKIGHVNTGLREEEIVRNLRKIKPSLLDASPPCISPAKAEWKCSICQEEYEEDDEIGKLDCGHGYHIFCIKQWLLQKNACPVCKTAVTKS